MTPGGGGEVRSDRGHRGHMVPGVAAKALELFIIIVIRLKRTHLLLWPVRNECVFSLWVNVD